MNRVSIHPHLVVSGSLWGLFALALPTIAAAERSDLEGVWLPVEKRTSEDIGLTSAGETAVANYVPFRDDPNFQCKPASLTNVFVVPDPPFEIRLHDGHVEMDFEYMDVKRRVPLDPALPLEDAPYTVAEHPHMGRSLGRYEGETLVVETAGQEAGVLDTIGPTSGYPQSAQMRTEERFTADDDSLRVVITHDDPVNYTEPFDVSFRYIRVDFEVLEFGCTLEEASFEVDRLK